jgi:hypothetical protein
LNHSSFSHSRIYQRSHVRVKQRISKSVLASVLLYAAE